jgi:hypothetical protein
MVLNLTVIVIFAIGFALRRDALDDVPVAALPLVLSVLALALLAASGWLGGKLTYTYGAASPTKTRRRTASDVRDDELRAPGPLAGSPVSHRRAHPHRHAVRDPGCAGQAAGSRHMGHIGGPSGSVSSVTAAKPWRSYSRRLSGLVASR